MTALRWTARIVGLLIVALVVALAIGEGFDPRKLNGAEWALTAAFVTSLAGMLLLWRWEGLGGALTIAGMLAFYAINFAAAGHFPGGPVFPLIFLPGVFAIVCWWRGRAGRRTHA